MQMQEFGGGGGGFCSAERSNERQELFRFHTRPPVHRDSQFMRIPWTIPSRGGEELRQVLPIAQQDFPLPPENTHTRHTGQTLVGGVKFRLRTWKGASGIRGISSSV